MGGVCYCARRRRRRPMPRTACNDELCVILTFMDDIVVQEGRNASLFFEGGLNSAFF
jgi:hypothetical protein